MTKQYIVDGYTGQFSRESLRYMPLSNGDRVYLRDAHNSREMRELTEELAASGLSVLASARLVASRVTVLTVG